MIRTLIRWLTQPLGNSKLWHEELFVDPTFGDCRFWSVTNGWSTHWQLSENRKITIMGRSKRPTPEQVVLWQQVQERMPQLIRDANDSIPDPPVKHFTPTDIRREGVGLTQVRFENDGTVHFFLDLTITEHQGIELSPHVIFKDWRIVSSEWSA